MTWRVVIAALLWVMLGAPAGDAKYFHGATGSGAASQTITAVGLSNNTFTSPGTIGQAVGTISVTMSPASPAFSGSLSLTGTNASDFTISGTTLEVNSSGLAAGSYTLNVVATQGGAIGSPFSQPETITGSSFTAACDTVTGGCPAAYSMTRKVVSAYAGSAFQLERASDSTTHDVGFSGNLVNLADALSFCHNTFCQDTIWYNQGSGGSANNLLATQFNGGFTCTSSALACAPPFWVDQTTGMPVIPTPYPAGMEVFAGGSGTTSGIPSGTVSKSVLVVQRSEDNTACCSGAGIMEQTAVGAGTMFALQAVYGNNMIGTVFCSAANANCLVLDLEGGGVVTTATGTNQHQLNIEEGQFDSVADKEQIWLNGTQILAPTAPPFAVNSGTWVRAGLAGDHTHVTSRLSEMLIMSDAGDHTTLRANVASFYGGLTPSVCQGAPDLYYVMQGYNSGTASVYTTPSGASYALRLLRAGYTGPIADLRNTLGTTNTYGRDPSSITDCGIDPAAVTFCAANGPCTVAGLYNQAGYFLNGAGQFNLDPNSVTKLVQTIVADQPTANFTGPDTLNGNPTMHFAGGQWLQSSGMGAWTEPWNVSAVTRRTGSFTSLSPIVSFDEGFGFLGFNTSVSTVLGKSTSSGSDPSQISGTASDNHWHAISFTSQTATGSAMSVDNVSVGTTTSQGAQTLIGYVAIGGDPDGGLGFMTGDIAEINLMAALQDNVQFDPTAIMFPYYEATWGSLPN